MRSLWTSAVLSALCLTGVVIPGAAAQAVPDRLADAFLERLVGRWRMSGEVRGRSAVYDVTVERLLNRRYVELHMLDTARPPQYETRLFIGADTAQDKVLAHWLDSFGVAFSVPPGVGVVSGDTMRVEFDYPTGLFRDTFVHRRSDDSWSIVLVSRDGAGHWQPFASYVMRRAAP